MKTIFSKRLKFETKFDMIIGKRCCLPFIEPERRFDMNKKQKRFIDDGLVSVCVGCGFVRVGMWVGDVLLVGLPVSFDQEGTRGGSTALLIKRRARSQRSLPGRLDDILALPLDRVLFSPLSGLRTLGKSLDLSDGFVGWK